jgi:hypothetical protein
MLGLVGYIRSKITTHDTVPSRVVLLIELFFDVSCNVFLDIIFLKSLKGVGVPNSEMRKS